MKALILKSSLAIALVVVFACQSMAQIMVNTRIDVRGSRFTDQAWIFAVPNCTRDFDNGWDAFKMISPSTLVPTLYAQEANGNFQIDAVPTMDNTYLAFKAGEDTVYTFTFNNEYVETMYKELYLVDSVANKTVSILENGTQYTFSVQPTSAPVKRFKVVAVPLTATTPTDGGTVVTPTDPTPGTGTVETPTPTVPADTVTTPTIPQEPVKTTIANVDFRVTKHSVFVDNKTKVAGSLKVFNATTGVMVKSINVKKNGATKVDMNVPKGVYTLKLTIGTETMSKNMVF